jgi:hypothetical protein
MNSFTRIGLPILIVVLAVFGMTYVKLYTSTTDENAASSDTKDGGTGKEGKLAREAPIKFVNTTATLTADPSKDPPTMKFWDPEVELGQRGAYVYWCSNKHDKPVTMKVVQTSCQCAEVSMAALPPQAYKEYFASSVLANSPLCPAPGPAALLSHLVLSKALNWKTVISKTDKYTFDLPPAGPEGPQIGLVRMTWAGNPPTGAKTITAELLAGIGEEPPMHVQLLSHILVVSAFQTATRDLNGAWTPGGRLDFGDMTENANIKRSIYLYSTTQPLMTYSVSLEGDPDPCISFSKPEMASEEELQNLLNYSVKDEKGNENKVIRSVKSLYRIDVNVHERTTIEKNGKQEVKQLDLGVLDRRVMVSSALGEPQAVPLKGRVLGDIRILSGSETGRIDLGNSFPTEQNREKIITLIAERPGLDVSLADFTPSFLKVDLQPLSPLDGRKQWRLRVTVPKGSLYGSLPVNSAVILKTNEAGARRIRFPVTGMAADTGGPRF